MTPRDAPPSRIETARRRLRPVRAGDVAALHRLLLRPGVRRFLLDGTVVERDWVEDVVAQSEVCFGQRSLGLWAVLRPSSDELVGVVGYREFRQPPALELMYALPPEDWGRGLATEVADAAIRAGFARGLREIRASTDAPNEASIRVLTRLGFSLRGREPACPPETKWEQLHFALAATEDSR